MKKLGLGVLGLGEGRSIISAALRSELWDVVQLCDLNEPLGRERSHEFSLDCFTTSLDELLANPRVDVVGIYTPDHLHAEHVVRALNAGKHVICTKPFFDDLAQAGKILAAQQAGGKAVMIGQSSRFFAPFARQRQHFETGAFGEIITVEAYYNADHRWFLKKEWAKKDAFKWLYQPVDIIRLSGSRLSQLKNWRTVFFAQRPNIGWDVPHERRKSALMPKHSWPRITSQ